MKANLGYLNRVMKLRSLALIVTMLCVPMTVSACGDGEMTADGYENISLAHAHEHWQEGATSPIPFAILDVRSEEEFADGHIAGAINIPVQVLASRLADVPKNKRLYVHCEAGVRSARAAKILIDAGIGNIEHIPAGMRGWRDAGYPVAK